MMLNKVIGCLFLTLFMLVPQFAFALHPELAIPEKVEAGHRACREIMRLGSKYRVEGLFSKEFEAGSQSCTRIDLAAAVQLLTEKMAEKVVQEGNGAVDREDLVLLSDLREELRAEMLLVGTRTFQSRNEGLGTRFSALTKNISLSGGLVGVLQGSAGNRPKDHVDLAGRGDLVFNFKVGQSTIAVIDVEATGGNGLDGHIGNFSVLNGVAGSSDDRVRFREAWVEHAAFNDRLIITAGKIDLTNYFDSNAVANDENSQFLAGALVNSAVLGAPGNGPGLRLQARLSEALVLGLGYGSGDTDSDDFIDHGYGIVELDYKLKLGELEGTYRGYASLDGAAADGEGKFEEKNGFGFGFSIDQQLTDKLTLFGRYGQRDKNVYATRRAWSLGWQYAGPVPGRKDDLLGFAYGQIEATGASSPEKLTELYYRAQLNEQIALTPVVQYLINPLGDRDQHNVMVFGLRSQILF